LLIVALQGQGSLRGVEQQLARAERAELRETGSERFVYWDSATLARERGQIEAYLKTKPDDPAALVLLGRVGRFLLQPARSAQCSPEHGCVLDSTFDATPFHAALDKALSIRGDDPEAHFWKARLIADGQPAIRDGEFVVEYDTSQMLVHARRAVALDSRNVRYREFLAVKLTDMGRYAEAIEVIRAAAGGKHPLHLILQDFERLPVPEGAISWPGGHAGFAAVGMDENPPRFAGQAGRSWIVTLSVDQLEAFYRRRWPRFSFFSTVDSVDGRKSWFQYFRDDRSGKLQPAQDSGFMAQLENADSYDGLIMGVGEAGPGVDRLGERYPAGVLGKDRFLEIVIVTGRRGPRPGR